MRTILQLIAGTVIGVFLLVIGIGLLANDGAPDCGGRKMSRDDTCVTTKRGKSTTRTYDQQKSSDRGAGIGMVVVGGLMALGSGGFLIAGVVGSRRNKNAAGVAAYPMTTDPQAYGQHGYAPQPSYAAPPRQAPQGYAPQPGFPAPAGFTPQPGYAPPPGPSQGYGSPQGYGPPPGGQPPFGPPNGQQPPPGPFSPHTRGQ
ncbi:hypothetical protein GOARA_052_00030 [Gordonia araii NBRC 100433]|uniref:Uncharacterized protein n=1 Tax=Gordonia araii NBRC 100433 TaxID=1073574 RepID=G7H2M9_9ACTN|nr:hypothetical protein [Gordonia araii]NNG98570.1 hypothetical protein [Gordonia araii NBRC 100433]GAB10104.1 hypothetical protein GOARA_052_00030 [Gordonia araii NBRC 100433]